MPVLRVRGRLRTLAVAVMAVTSLTSLACSAVQKAAAEDPQRCERDPKCTSKHDKSRDCSTSCSDDIDCMRRCEEIQRQR